MIRLIACDLDGTLLQNGENSLEPELFPVIKSLASRGCMFAAASGRQYPNLKRLFEPVRDDIIYICENGALIVYKNRLLYKAQIEREFGREIMRAILGTEGCEVLLSGVNTSYLQPKEDDYVRYMTDVVGNHVTVVDDIFQVEEPYIKISAYDKHGTDHSEEHFRRLFSERLSVVTSGNVWLDMIPPGVHKGNALKRISALFHIPLSEMAAFGDNLNDLEMLQEVGCPVAVSNAKPKIKAYSRYVVPRVKPVLDFILERDLEI